MTNYLIAVDGGGTKTQIICATNQGIVIKSALVGPIGLTSTSLGAAVFNLKEGIRQVTENLTAEDKIVHLTMGLAGMDTPKEIKEVKQVFSNVFDDLKIETYLITNDAIIALENGTQKDDALVLISGTGSNCLGRNSSGMMAKAGGLDYLLTDEGSGFAIGLETLKIAVKSADGRIAKSILEKLVKKHFNVEDILDLKSLVYNPNLTKMEVASLAQLCFIALRSNDFEAKKILNQAIEELFLLALVILKKLQLVDKPVDCVLAGRINHDQYIYQNLANKLQAINSQINIIIPQTDSVYGALKIALKQLYGPNPIS